MKPIFSLLLIVTCVQLINGIVVQDGTCPEIKSVENFDVKKFAGTWYVAYSDPMDHEIHLKCTTETFAANGETPGQIDGVFEFIDIKTNERGNLTYAMRPIDDPKVANFLIGSTSGSSESFKYSINLIATDYENYAVFWCCKVKDNKSYRVIIIEGRQPNLSENALKEAYDVLDKNHLDRTQMQKIVQDCAN